MTVYAECDVNAVQQRTVKVLMVAHGVGKLGSTVGLAVATVLAYELSGKESLAGLVPSVQVLGAATGSYLLARLMGARGRRIGLATGYMVGGLGAGICVLGGAAHSFPLFLVGAVLMGADTATNYQSRYAAADLAVPERRARALSMVLWAATLGAVLGPSLVGPAGDLAVAQGLPSLTGPFLVSGVVVLVAALVIEVALRPDPLLVARAVAGRPDGEPHRRTSWRQLRALAFARPKIAAGVLAMAVSHAAKVAVAVMAPLHMNLGGAGLGVIGVVLSLHAVGMFFFSPLVGLVADRAGAPWTLLYGAGVTWAGLWLIGSSPQGTSVQIGAGLFLLGLGWSCCMVAASAMLVECTPIDDRTAVQGAADLLMNLAAGVASLAAGVVVAYRGFAALNAFASLLILAIVAIAFVSRREPATY